MKNAELLHFAAKAFGAERIGMRGDEIKYGVAVLSFEFSEYDPWNPLLHLGDALLTASKLKISLDFTNYVIAYGGSRNARRFTEENTPEGVCLAITRAAAEIGRTVHE